VLLGYMDWGGGVGWLGLMALWSALSCTSMLGLETLDAVPGDFPLTLTAPTGNITRAEHGQVSVDLVYEEKTQAEAGWKALRTQAEAAGWSVVEDGKKGKVQQVTLEGPQGRIALGCCRPRADRQQLVFVSWWPASE